MTKDEKFYLAMAITGLQTVKESNLQALMQANPERGLVYLFDIAYGLGFTGAQKMASEGIDIQSLKPRELSLIQQQ